MSEQLVDERIVAMRFDNSQFEKNVSTSINTLDKLKGSLNLEGAAKSLENVNSAADKMHFNILSGAVDSVKERFSALEVMGVTALANITNSAVNAGKRILNSLTLEPVKEGFSEYELKMGSVQTIMNSTGESLDTVNKHLEELNVYADKTIYSFSDMTSNIGKFTNAGVKLEDAVKAIQGVSNVAAVSGANANEASRAMYNFAQSLSGGFVKYVDWKSIENANMSTVEFRSELIKTALELGTIKQSGDKYVSTTTNIKGKVSDAFDATSMFNESLNHQWMTTDVLVKTLNKYSDETTELGKKAFAAAQDVKTFSQLLDTLKEAAGSGWAQTWEIVFGDYEESKKLWTGLSNVVGGFIDRQSQARNTLLETWKKYGGQQAIIDSFKNVFNAITSVIKPLKEAFRTVIPPITAESLMRFSNGLKNLTSRFKMSDETTKNLKNTFKGLASIIGIVKNLLSAVYRSIKPLIESLGESGLIGKILSVTGAAGKWLYTINRMIIRNDVFYKGIQIGVSYIKKAIDAVKKAIDAVKAFAETVRQKLHLPEFEKVKQGFFEFFELIKSKLSEFGKHTSDGIKNLCKKISGAFSKNIETPGIDNVNKKLDKTEGILKKISDAFNSFKEKLINGLKALGEAIKNSKIGQFFIALFNAVWKVLKTVGKYISDGITRLTEDLKQGDFSGLLNFVKIIATGGIAISIKKFFDTLSSGVKPIKGVFRGITGVFKGITGAFKGVQGCLEAYQSKLKADVLLKIAIAVGILAASIVALSLVDPAKLDAAVGGITVLFADLVGSMAIFNKIAGSAKNTSKLSSALVVMSVAVLTLSFALKKVATLNNDEITRGLFGIAGMSTVLVSVAKILSKNEKQMMKGASSLIVFAFAVKILASVCKKLSELPWDGLVKGLWGVCALLFEMAMFLQFGKFDSQKMLSTSMGMILIATAVRILANSCKAFGAMSWDEIAKGLFGVGVVLAELALFVNGINNKKIFASSIALIAIGFAMKLMASVCKSLAELSWEGLAKGLLGFYGILVGIAAFVTQIDDKKIFASSIALLLMGAALKIMASVCKTFSEMDWESLAKGLVGMGVLLLELGLFVSAIDNKKIFMSSVAIILIGTAIKKLVASCIKLSEMSWEELIKGLVGVGAILLEIALFSKLVSGGKKLIAVSAALVIMGSGMKKFAAVCKIFGSMSIQELVASLVALAAVFLIIGAAGKILGPMVPTLIKLAGALALMGVAMVAFGAGLLLAGLGLAAAVGAIIAFANALSISSVAIISAVELIAKKIIDLIPYMLKKLGEGLIELIKMIKDSVPLLMDTAKTIILSLAEMLIECTPTLIETVFTLLMSILDAAGKYVPTIVEKVFDLLIAVLNKIAEKLPELIGAAVNVLAAFFKGIFDAFNNMDSGTFASMLSGIKIVAEILLVLAGLGALAVPAMAGVISVGVLAAELTGVLAALGALEQIPGLNWIIGEGGKLLGAIGGAIGDFIGGLVGSALEGIASTLPGIGENLAAFFEKAEPFLNGASKLSASTFDGIKGLVEVILMLTGANIIESLTSWLTGGSSLSKFAEELAAFGPKLNEYYNSVKGVKGDVVTASANAASSLAQMAKKLPKHGGLVDWFFGSATLTTFANELASFGPAMRSYYFQVKDIKGDVVSASADAASSLAEMSKKLPKHGGLLEWFTGSATLTTFARELNSFGPAMKAYYVYIKDIKGDVVTASANAAASLAELSQKLPAHGGVVQWFTGDATLTTFARELDSFGPAMKHYANSISGIDADAVKASASAALMLTEVNNNLPETGGLRGFINGDKSLVTFAEGLAELGPAMTEFTKGTAGMESENIDTALLAIKCLADVNNELPNVGGLNSWFFGQTEDFAVWAAKLKAVGTGINDFADNVSEIKTTGLDASVSALESLAKVNNQIPSVGGLNDLLFGEQDFKKWSAGLSAVGTNINQYAENVSDIKTDGLEASAVALEKLSLVNQNIPNVGGLRSLVEGDKSLEAWTKDLGTVGTNIKAYADNVYGLKTGGLTASVTAIETLAKANSYVPEEGGFKQLFTGEQSLSTFGSHLANLGSNLATFSANLENVSVEKMTGAADIVKILAESARALGNSADEQKFKSFSTNVPLLEEGVKHLYGLFYAQGMLEEGKLAKFKRAIEIVTDLIKIGIELNKMDYAGVYEVFGESLGKMALHGFDKFEETFNGTKDRVESSVAVFVGYFADALNATTIWPTGMVANTMLLLANYIAKKLDAMEGDWKTTGHDMINNLSSGLYEQNTKKLTTTLKNILTGLVTDAQNYEYKFRTIGNAMMTELIGGIDAKKASINEKADLIVTWIMLPVKGSYDKFTEIGGYLVAGFAKGINDNKAKAEEAAKSMAKAASDAAAKKLDEHSPSKVGYRIGDYFGVGFVNAILDIIPDSYNAGADVAESARRGLSKAVSLINGFVDDNIDSDPTIRPVLDLTQLSRDVQALDGMISASQSVYLAGNTSAAFNSAHSVSREMKVDNAAVVSEIQSLKNEVAALNTVIGNMRVVMDTGALVGSIATPMNAALGRRAAYERRGN